ncbi:MAG: inverse autotransporter beta domain-containing protein [Rickettsiales bacterium]|nr:inverse autotransporter beta domain-containing protein [Rickettsiales bacterium]MCA0254541.1 inverse autotransporter beta domain-containing protein [Pseudomonadota bacterium]
MKSFLPKTTTALSTSIITAALLISSVVKAEQSQEYIYNPSAEVSTKFSKGRNIAELNYMQPFFAKENNLPILDLKLKLDNRRSKEINLGLVYRYNYEDKVIFGTYAYFDHRYTGTNYSVSGLTAGVEALSEYIDARANIYIPQNKKKKTKHNSKKTVEIDGTSIFAISGGHTYESSLKGYDIEIGTPIFAFSDSLNEKLGTKIHVARYSFTAKNVKPIKGTRFRVEQNLGETWIGDNKYRFHISAETQFDKVRKRQNFIGLGLKVTFNDKQNLHKKKSNSLNHRMMETVIRDVDIVTESNAEAPIRSNFYMNGKKIEKIYYVGSAGGNYSGSGTQDSPLSIEQLKSMNYDDAVIVLTSIDPNKGGTAISRQDYVKIQEMPQVLNGKKDTILSTGGTDPVTIKVDGTQGVSISSQDDKNTSIVVKDAVLSALKSDNTSVIHLLEPKIEEIVKTQIEAARVDLARVAVEETRVEQAVQVMRQEEVMEVIEAVNQAIAIEAAARVAEPEQPQIVVQPQPVLVPQGTLDSGITRANLNPNQQALYDIMMLAAGLQTDDDQNLYVVRQVQYDDVANIINTNPAENIAAIEARIDLRADLNPVTKAEYKKIAATILGFDGVAQGGALDGGQQGIGLNHKGPKDITTVASLERLRADYGILDGQMAIDVVKQFVTTLMQQNIPGIGVDAGADALRHRDTVPTQRYQDAANQYLNSIAVPPGENAVDREIRLQRKRLAKVIMDDEIKTSLTAVNNTMAAYRALIRMETTLGGVFTEEVTGRYNDKEMLAYVILANLDVREVQKNLVVENKPLTPENIFNRQKENMEGLILRLGNSQRAYNVDHSHGAVDVGGVNNAVGGIRGVADSVSCAHGLCVRIVDSALHHSKVVLSDASPASFSDEFNQAVQRKADALPLVQRQEVKAWKENLEDAEVRVDYVGNQVAFSTPVIQGGTQVDIPASYKQVLSEIATEMDNRYNFTHANPKLQLVKRPAVTNVFKNALYIPVNED